MKGNGGQQKRVIASLTLEPNASAGEGETTPAVAPGASVPNLLRDALQPRRTLGRAAIVGENSPRNTCA